MKTRNNLFAMAMLAALTLLPTACQNNDFLEEENTTARVPRQASMVLNAAVPSFETSATRAVSTDWDNGSKIYLQFGTNSGMVDGVATYNASSKSWNVEYYGTITSAGTCEAYYFENAGSADYASVKLTPSTAIYADRSGNYTLEDGTLTVTATLRPLTGRMRFKGTSGQSFHCRGFNSYSTYSITSNTFESSATTVDDKVGSTGYSSYYYGFFPNESQKVITFDDFTNSVVFTKMLGANALAAGKSGYLDIPTTTNRNGWAMETYKADIAVTAGLIAYYPFDDSTADDAVGEYHGFMTGGSFISDTPSGMGKALYLKESEYVTIGSAPLSGKSAYTVNMWIKDFGTSNFLRTSDVDYNLPPSLVLSNSLKFVAATGVMSGSGRYTFEPTFSSYQTDQWVMVTLVGENKAVTLYINGRKVDSGTGSTSSYTGNKMTIGGSYNTNYTVGSSYNTASGAFKMDNLRLHSVALTDAQIAEIYNAEKKQ